MFSKTLRPALSGRITGRLYNSIPAAKKTEATIAKPAYARKVAPASSATSNALLNNSTLEESLPNKLDDFDPLQYTSTQGGQTVNWATSFHGIGTEAFPDKVADVLLAPVVPSDIEIKPDGIIYLPEIKYRRILNRAFGPGGWGLVPRSATITTGRSLTREYGLVCHGRLVAVARGEQDFFNEQQMITATEGCKSNALMRCCKDLGIASELWDPRFVRNFKKKYTEFKTPPGKVKGAWALKSPF
ncbi:hypothetical protein BABINDRAFT_161775 [Babjeviella inositovora NRRL Y-12698]|uniref:Mitochondrial genome maintenance protein MGM101 n=1 Tax=Babjeviella inositovora NRRL Y-12698 TaxID=984486 RepID=A0A1E3QP03_9ASCO|nr:uncharacterized protein BABINDRAFT_161775 [Babjeviella inositovora NRRL Y-12698]ODQ79368.1 hypothetical protein BABINDRAFT_161775 [Babjeviella inositovora NRRL Y-12698]